jgi:cation diffusion facilitator CzcD-associated flavoprotein CzcO
MHVSYQEAAMNVTGAIAAPLDVLIVGAGLSGIGLAIQLAERCPGKRFAIVERRERLGGTWDLFRYPGIRSDSDMFTLGFESEPWTDEKAIAEGATIRGYLERIIDERGLRPHLRLGRKVIAADWDSKAALWTLSLEGADGNTGTLQTRFLYMGSGFYDYDAPYDAAIPGLEDFSGTVAHPQFWPEQLDYAGRRVLVIGSGATAATILPAMAQTAEHVTLLQRTPSWYFALPARDRLANFLRKILPAKAAYALTRMKNVAVQRWVFSRARNKPEVTKAFLHKHLASQLGPDYNRADFSPPYNPWEQRMCLVPDGDFFQAIKSGKADIVTGMIDRVDKSGVRLTDGTHLEADIIVTATGLSLAVLGKVAISLDGAPVNFAEHFFYRNCMYSNVPNFASLFGYLNAAWTLRVDIVADWLCRLLNQMDAWNVDVVTPYLPGDHKLVAVDAFGLFTSNYIKRASHLAPKSSTTAPWQLSMDYSADRRQMRDAPIDDGVLRFARVGLRQARAEPNLSLAAPPQSRSR